MSEAPIRLVHTQNAVAQGLSHSRVFASESGSIVIPFSGLTSVYNARGTQFQPGADTVVNLEVTLGWSDDFGMENSATDSDDVTWEDLGPLTAGEIFTTNKIFTFARLTFTDVGFVDIVG
jgi:hypothetical protein